MSALTFTPGKFYRTRDGRKARIYATDGVGIQAIHGAILCSGEWRWNAWNCFGTFHPSGENSTDLIAEWKDAPEVDWSQMPAWAVAVAQQKQGSWLWFSASPVKAGICWICPNGSSGLIPGDYCPKWSGDWRDSLVTRPTEGAQP